MLPCRPPDVSEADVRRPLRRILAGVRAAQHSTSSSATRLHACSTVDLGVLASGEVGEMLARLRHVLLQLRRMAFSSDLSLTVAADARQQGLHPERASLPRLRSRLCSLPVSDRVSPPSPCAVRLPFSAARRLRLPSSCGPPLVGAAPVLHMRQDS